MTYVPRLPPRKHQITAQERVRARPRSPSRADVFAWLMDMGTGKSKVAMDEFGARWDAGDRRDLLIIAPKGSYRNWFEDHGDADPSEFRKHFSADLYDRLLWAPWRSGAAARNRLRATLECCDPGVVRAMIVNIEALSRGDRAFEACRMFLESSLALRRGSVMVVDESTRIKGPDSERTETVTAIGELANSRRIMSGLVSPNSPMDLWSQFNFLDWKILGQRSWFGFRARYAITRDLVVNSRVNEAGEKVGGHSIKQIVDYRNLPELTERVGSYSYRVLKDECLDLPPKVYSPIRYVELTDRQRQIYDDLVRTSVAELDAQTYVTATMVLTRRMRLDQVACGFVKDENGVEHALPENRTDALLEILEEYSGKTVIWTSHVHCVNKIYQVLRENFGPRSVGRFFGGNVQTRGEDERRFKQDPACLRLVATAGAGGVGNNWQVAGQHVFFNNDDNLEHRVQAEDRTHRDGLVHPFNIQDICASETQDYKKIVRLRKKLDIASAISGDDYREWLI